MQIGECKIQQIDEQIKDIPIRKIIRNLRRLNYIFPLQKKDLKRIKGEFLRNIQLNSQRNQMIIKQIHDITIKSQSKVEISEMLKRSFSQNNRQLRGSLTLLQVLQSQLQIQIQKIQHMLQNLKNAIVNNEEDSIRQCYKQLKDQISLVENQMRLNETERFFTKNSYLFDLTKEGRDILEDIKQEIEQLIYQFQKHQNGTFKRLKLSIWGVHSKQSIKNSKLMLPIQSKYLGSQNIGFSRKSQAKSHHGEEQLSVLNSLKSLQNAKSLQKDMDKQKIQNIISIKSQYGFESVEHFKRSSEAKKYNQIVNIPISKRFKRRKEDEAKTLSKNDRIDEMKNNDYFHDYGLQSFDQIRAPKTRPTLQSVKSSFSLQKNSSSFKRCIRQKEQQLLSSNFAQQYFSSRSSKKQKSKNKLSLNWFIKSKELSQKEGEDRQNTKIALQSKQYNMSQKLCRSRKESEKIVIINMEEGTSEKQKASNMNKQRVSRKKIRRISRKQNKENMDENK